MAKKKVRTPPPPRRAQPPKPRTGQRGGSGQAPKARTDRGHGRGRRVWMVGGGALVAVVIAAAAIAVLAFGGSSTAEETIRGAGCTLVNRPAMQHNGKPDQRHLTISELRKFKYATFPPSSGAHYGIPAPFEVYDQPVDQFRLVHNLEHGGLVIQYGSKVPKAQVDELLAWYRKDPNAIVIAPLPALGDKISMAAWSANTNRQTGRVTNQEAHLAKCGGFDEKAVDAFEKAYAFRGPERYPRSILTPGT